MQNKWKIKWTGSGGVGVMGAVDDTKTKPFFHVETLNLTHPKFVAVYWEMVVFLFTDTAAARIKNKK